MKTLKHNVRDFLISLISVLGLPAIYRWLVSRKRPLVRVLCFHDVTDKEWFLELVEALKRNYRIVTPEQFSVKDFTSDKINLLLTFDDGYESWISTVLPTLRQFGVKGVFFISSGLLDAKESGADREFFKKRLLLDQPRIALSWGGAKEIVAEGHMIGGHTVSHPSLAKLSKEEAGYEIFENKKILEQRLEVSLKHFAYPFGSEGDHNDVVKDIALSAGYRFIYTAEPGFCGTVQAKIKRTLMEERQSQKSVRAFVEGAYDIFFAAKRLL